MTTDHADAFEFERARGIVWVCDLEGSTSFLNEDRTVDMLEAFLPRLYWVATQIVAAAGGVFVKWTGDGFLAWFQCPLHRGRGKLAARVFEAAWHLSYLANVTGLGARAESNSVLRHGVTYEQDALVLHTTKEAGAQAVDLIGRDVVLAFRFAGIRVSFPGIVTQADLVKSSRAHRTQAVLFTSLRLDGDDILRFFKGQRRGTRSAYGSSQKTRKVSTRESLVRSIKRTINKAESGVDLDAESVSFVAEYTRRMSQGPTWAQQIAHQLVDFTRSELLGALKTALPVLQEMVRRRNPPTEPESPQPGR